MAEGGTTDRAEESSKLFLPISLAPQSVSQSVKRPSHIVWRGRPMHGAFEAPAVPICKDMNKSNLVTSLGHGIGRTIACHLEIVQRRRESSRGRGRRHKTFCHPVKLGVREGGTEKRTLRWRNLQAIDGWMDEWIEELVRKAAELNDWMRGLRLTDKQASHPLRLRSHAMQG